VKPPQEYFSNVHNGRHFCHMAEPVILVICYLI
jgi:hypothetical protein